MTRPPNRSPHPPPPRRTTYLLPHAASSEFTDAPLTLVNPNLVASSLEEDYLAHAGPDSGAYVIYLLNPNVKGPYAYTYDNE